MKMKFAAIAMVLLSSGVAQAQDWAVEFYGGAALGGNLEYHLGSYDLDAGHALGFGIYNTSIEGIELGADLMNTGRGFTGYSTGANSISAMFVARVPFHLSDDFSVYAGAGAGVIDVIRVGAGTYNGHEWVPGVQASLGARFAIGETSSMFAEVKHQNALRHALIDSISATDRKHEFNATSVLLGFRQEF